MTLFNEIKNKASHLLRGEKAEDQAHRFLLAQGLKPVRRNFRCKQGELDLIMMDGSTLVIVEVRFRQSNRFGGAAESVTSVKQSRIIAATHTYLSTINQYGPIRFDVIAMSGSGGIEWIKNAFSV